MRLVFSLMSGFAVGVALCAITLYAWFPDIAAKLQPFKDLGYALIPVATAMIGAAWQRANALSDREYYKQRETQIRDKEREYQAQRDKDSELASIRAESRSRLKQKAEQLHDALEAYISATMIFGLWNIQSAGDSDIKQAAKFSSLEAVLKCYVRLELLLDETGREALRKHYTAISQLKVDTTNRPKEEQDQLVQSIVKAKRALIDAVNAIIAETETTLYSS